MAIFTGLAATNNTFIGTAGADTFNFTVANLNGADTLTGNGGTDTLVLTGAGAVLAASLAGMTSVEALTFGNGGISVTFSDAVANANGGILAVTGSSGNDTLDYSGVTLATRSFNVVAGAGNDVFRGGAGNDVFRFAANLLTAADTVQGGSSGTVDQLIFETAGTIAAANLANVGGIERVILANGTNDITLSAAMGASAQGGLIQVFGGTGNDRVSATLLTGGARVDVTAGAGLDTLLGTAAGDTFRFAGADLAGDTVNGGVGYDNLVISTADALSAADLALVSNIDQITLNVAGSSLTLNNAVATANAGVLAVFGSSGNDTVDASTISTTRSISVTANGGNDTLRGGTGNDVFRFNAADLTAADTVAGGNGIGIDAINFQAAGTVTAANLAGVSGIERIALAAGTNAITLTNALLNTASGNAMTVFTNSGNDTVDGSTLTGANKLEIYAGLGNDTLRGGTGNDVFRFSVTGLDGSDTVAGGLGFDQLNISTAGALTTAKLAGVSGIDQIVFSTSGAVLTLNNAVAAANAASLAVFGSIGNDTIDATAVTDTTRGLSVTALAGNDSFRGGLGTDTFRFNAADLTSLDIVQGGGGSASDGIVFLAAGTVTTAAFANVSGIEVLSLAVGGVSLALTNALVASANNRLVTVNGSSGNDTINASAVTTATNRITVNAGAGNDTLTGGAWDDTFRFAAVDLNGDTINGGAGNDVLQLTTAGVLGETALSGMSEVDEILLFSSGTNGITLVDGNFSSTNRQVAVTGGSGNDTVNGSSLTGIRTLDVTAGAGLDVLRGGAGADAFRFAAADLTAGDTVQGGGRLDTLRLTTAGVLAPDALTGVNGVDKIILSAGDNEITLTDANYILPLQNPNRVAVEGSAGASRIDASGLTGSNALDYSGGGGVDTVLGGAGADEFNFRNGSLFIADTTITGGAGFDTIYFDQSMDFLSNTITGVEGLISFAPGAATVTISGRNARPMTQMGSFFLNGATQTFNIQLRADDDINFSNLTLRNRDAGDAIHVIGSDGFARITLSADIASYTGGTGDDTVLDSGGVQAISLGEGNDGVSFLDGNLFAAGDTIDGGGGDFDRVRFDRSMDFLGDTITNVEELFYQSASDANVTISGENAARLRSISNTFGNDGFTQTYTVQLSAGSTTDLSQLSLNFADANDAINVVSTSGNTAVTLNNQIARFTGSGGNDTVSLAPGVQYRLQSVIDGGEGDDRIAYDGSVDRDVKIYGGSGNDTLVVTGAAAINLSDSFNHISGTSLFATVIEFENVDASASTASVTLRGRSDVTSILIGSSAADTIIAGIANAEITGGPGGDVLVGNVENERFFFRSTAEAAGDTIDGGGGGSGYDSIEVLGDTDFSGASISNIDGLVLGARDAAGSPINASVTATMTGAQAAALTDVYGNTAIAGTVETLVVNAGEGGVNLSASLFFDWGLEDRVEINGTSANDTITGTSQNDVIAGATGGNDTLSGAGGDDVIGYDFFLSGTLNGGNGIDTVRLDSVSESFIPQSVTVDLAAGRITEFAAGNSPFGFDVTNFENADFSFGVFAATMNGTTGGNTLIGGSAADTLTGARGADTLTGGEGADSFVWNDKAEGGDTITDFAPGVDKLRFTAAAFAVDGVFDTLASHSVGVTDDITGIDLLSVTTLLNTATEVRAYLDTQTTTADHGMFVVADNALGNAVLYYTSNATDGVAGNQVFQIADLGADTGVSLSDFVFV